MYCNRPFKKLIRVFQVDEEDVVEDNDEKTGGASDDDDIAHDSLIKAPKKGKPAAATTAKGKGKAKK